ncbi:MAG TPA: ABC transporter permease [Bacteroidales bacterium]|nr:ABC transporter permease [Bacteroidales bacterium]
MNPFKLAFRPLFRKGEHTTARIISLSAGLAFGILLLAEVFYYYSYDSFYPDSSRIYVVHENFKRDKSVEKLMSYPRVSGAIAPGLKAEVPGIEAACRLNSIGRNVFYTEDLNNYEAEFSLSDEYLFDVLPRPMISGNPKEILKTPMSCLISTKIAEAIGGEVIGKVITLKRFPDKKLTIAGVFKDLPENTNYEYDILISMVSTKQFTWDGTANWLGNDRYYSCVKLEPGVNPESLAPAVRKMQEIHQDISKLEKEQGGVFLKYSFLPMRKMHADNVKDMIIILSTIAFAVLFVSLMNYILLTLSALVNRAKSSAIYKTFGAQTENLHQLILIETFLLFFISVIGAVFIIAASKPIAEAQLQHSIRAVLNPYVIWPLLAIVVVSVIVTSYLPGRFFSRIPVATVFRSYKLKNKTWKLVLLAIQFIGASFILTVMIIVTIQFSRMKNADHGYQVKGVYYGSTVGMEGSKLSTVLNELRAMPEVEKVGLGSHLPLYGASGNNVRSQDGKKDLFNVADFYQADENFLSILNIQVSVGNNFSPEDAATNDVLISKKGEELLKLNLGWTDGIVGKQVEITEHGTTTVCGVFPDFIINSLADPDLRPSVFFYLPEGKFEQLKTERPDAAFMILIKVNEGAEAGMIKKITNVFNLGMPQKDASVSSLEYELQNRYNTEKGFRNALMAGNAVILLITIIGLLGYTANEANRHQKELTIRKISGATVSNILRIFIFELEYIAIPSVLVGLIGAWFTVNKWMQNFAVKVPLHWGIFVLCSFSVLLIVALIGSVNYYRSANRNPIEALRYE